ncbi:MAG: fructose-1,6-bisphosphatase [Lachnospiraceae bacterium]|nr:fructose-1,6-bisphosphatase [Lachnospiraceae bacterium]MBO5145991.1 fructose-1,6-bisphosphatase [Lachnospiraceae bacterium]
MTDEKMKYLRLLAKEYPSIPSVCREIINLKAILNLPKGTEHFMSDIHGEYEAFYHIMNNAAGVIKEKVDMIFAERMTPRERQELCTLVYYPVEKIKLLKKQNVVTPYWYKINLKNLTELAKFLSSKYTRSKVRKALPPEFSYIIDELLHAQPDEDNNQYVYHEKILDTIIDIDSADAFIEALGRLIKRLAVDHLHIVGDIYDRGANADKIMDLLMNHHSVDIEWGNHDILWMGAACGNEACIANVLRNNIKYNNIEILENSYAISLRSLTLFAEKTYPRMKPMEAALKAISVILFKLEGQIIMRHPEYDMVDRLLLDKIDKERGVVRIGDREYALNDKYFPTLNEKDAYTLTDGEQHVIDDLKTAFVNSHMLRKHVRFLYEKGNTYRCYNGNLLFHGCIPMTEEGGFDGMKIGGQIYKGRAYMDYAAKVARRAYFGTMNQSDIDFMWYLWCGKKSPLAGRTMKTFERTFVVDESTYDEPKNPYYRFYQQEEYCIRILHEFGLDSAISHIINGHTPIKVAKGESPLKANNRLIVIDGGFCRAYQKTTGIAGYTLIYNSHGMRLKAHQPFESIAKVLSENKDIESSSNFFETETERVMVKDTDNGKVIMDTIHDLELLLAAYRQGLIVTK